MKQLVIIDDSLVPAGYVLAGEYRCALPCEPFLSGTGNARVLHENDKCGLAQPRLILRKVEPVKESRWMPAPPALIANQWDSREAAVAFLRTINHCCTHLACFTIENGTPVAVALEPLTPGSE